MTDLKQLVKQIAANKALVATDLETAPSATRASLKMMVIDAKEQLERQLAEYAGLIRQNSVGIFLFGDDDRQEAYVKVASEEAAVVSVRGDGLYQALANRVEPSLGPTREFGPTQLGLLHVELRSQLLDLDVREVRMPRLNAIEAVPDRKALVSYVRRLVRESVEDDLLKLYVNKAVNDRAVEQHFSAKTLPVVVVGLENEQEVAALAPLFKNTSTVNVGAGPDAVDKDYVLSSLTAIKKNLSKKN